MVRLPKPRNIGLGPRLALIAAVALLPALGTILYNEAVFRQVRGMEVHQTALRTAELAALEMERIISGSSGILAAMARAPVVRAFSEQDCAPYLRDLRQELPQFNAIAALDAEGNLRCRSSTARVVTGFQKRPYFQAVMRDRSFTIGEYMESSNDPIAVLPLAVPINDAAGTTIGVLVAGLSLDWLGNRLRERQFAANSSLTIADRNGVIIAREPLPERFVGTRIPANFLHLISADQPGTLELTSQDGTERVQGYFPATVPPLGIYVSAGISKTDAFRSINEATQRNLLLAMLSALAAFAIAHLVARQLVLRPVRLLQATIDNWRVGQTATRTGMSPDRDEISDVGASIDAFLAELNQAREERQRADQQRDMLGRELQHRIKNLLATVQAIATQTFAKHEDVDQLETFSQRLAAMGKAQSVLVTRNWTDADLTEVVSAGTSLFQAAERFQISGPPMMISARAAMSLSMALHELCTNAVKYGALSKPEGYVSISWSVARADQPIFSFFWQEHDGPAVTEPLKAGFGTQMIQKVLAYEISGTVKLAYAPEGVSCTVTAPLDIIIGDGSNAA
jgi:two-component sensor histidine kinase